MKLLPVLLPKLPTASSAVQQPLGLRSPAVGFAVEVANTLLQCCDDSNTDGYCATLAKLLDIDQQWQQSIEPDGAILSTMLEQDGQLCGECVAGLLAVSYLHLPVIYVCASVACAELHACVKYLLSWPCHATACSDGD